MGAVTGLRTTTAALLLGLLLQALPASAAVPIQLRQTIGGQVNYLSHGISLRALPDSATDTNGNGIRDACEVINSATFNVTGIPATATVRRAWLYWAGSSNSVDATVNFNGGNVTADRTFTETFTFGGTNFNFYAGFEDVTTQVVAGRNQGYSFSGMAVSTGTPWCTNSAVLKGAALFVVYEDASEPQRVINLFDGLRFFRGSAITLTPSNFKVPPAAEGIDGKTGYLTWEGDPGNSATLNGFAEAVQVNGSTLTSAGNPTNNQFNGTDSDEVRGILTTGVHGVDLDVYDITSLLSAGDTSVTTTYSSGQDLVLLSAQVFSIRTNTADLVIDKRHTGDLFVGLRSDWEIDVTNNGPVDVSNIQVTDTLPTGVTFDAFQGAGWSCSAAGQDLTCDYAPTLVNGASTTLVIEVLTDNTVAGSVDNTANVDSPDILELVPANNTDTDTRTSSNAGPDVLSMKMAQVVSDPTGGANPKAIPGAVVQYSIVLSNQGAGTVDDDGMALVDTLPPDTALFVGDLGGTPSGPVAFVDGVGADSSGLNAAGLVVEYSTDGSDFSYTPMPDADGFDDAVTHLRLTPDGVFAGTGGGGTPTFTLRYQVRVD